jgi:fructose-1,6-bisphosphatase/inositol monophosphatase family enzyme
MLASGYLDAIVEVGLEPDDFLSMVPIIESAGGAITNLDGNQAYGSDERKRWLSNCARIAANAHRPTARRCAFARCPQTRRV